MYRPRPTGNDKGKSHVEVTNPADAMMHEKQQEAPGGREAGVLRGWGGVLLLAVGEAGVGLRRQRGEAAGVRRPGEAAGDRRPGETAGDRRPSKVAND